MSRLSNCSKRADRMDETLWLHSSRPGKRMKDSPHSACSLTTSTDNRARKIGWNSRLVLPSLLKNPQSFPFQARARRETAHFGMFSCFPRTSSQSLISFHARSLGGSVSIRTRILRERLLISHSISLVASVREIMRNDVWSLTVVAIVVLLITRVISGISHFFLLSGTRNCNLESIYIGAWPKAEDNIFQKGSSHWKQEKN